MNLGARLYAYTGNETYATWANKTYDWMSDVGLVGGTARYSIYDGTSENNNCENIESKTLWLLALTHVDRYHDRPHSVDLLCGHDDQCLRRHVERHWWRRHMADEGAGHLER